MTADSWPRRYAPDVLGENRRRFDRLSHHPYHYDGTDRCGLCGQYFRYWSHMGKPVAARAAEGGTADGSR